MDSICPRCGATLQFADGAPPLFCGQCGLPQLRVSEDALVGSVPVPTPQVEGTVDWPRALRIVGAASAVGAGLPMLLPGALATGAVGGASLLMTPVLTLASVFTYARGRSGRVTSTAAGARMGAVLGLLMGTIIAFATGIAGFVLRYGRHSRVMDDTISQVIGQMSTQLAAQSASMGAPAPGLLAFVASPEFRAGFFLTEHVFSLLLLVAAGSVCGWLSAALLRSRRVADAD